MVILCKGCDTEGTGLTGTLADNTPPGWGCFLIRGGLAGFLCAKCSEKAGGLAVELLKIVKNDMAHFPGLIKIGKDRPWLT